MSRFRLAQFNIARLLAPLDSPQLASFVARLEEINALADRAPGFIWRFRSEGGDATALRPYADDRIIVNFSVWTDIGPLRDFVYRTAHAEVMRRRREWFERLHEPVTVLWWVPEGHLPDINEAMGRLAALRNAGDAPQAFSFAHLFPPPDVAAPPTEAAP